MKTPSRNKYIIVDSHTYKGLDSNGKPFWFDKCDYDLLSQYSWHVNRDGYVVASENGKTISMHRLLMNPPVGTVVDHCNHNTSDNRKENLRICKNDENIRNISAFDSSGFRRGVYASSKGVYTATFNYRGLNLKEEFCTYQEAASQRTKWEEEYHGEFAPWDRNDREKNLACEKKMNDLVYEKEKSVLEEFDFKKPFKPWDLIRLLKNKHGLKAIDISNILPYDIKRIRWLLQHPECFTLSDLYAISTHENIGFNEITQALRKDFK